MSFRQSSTFPKIALLAVFALVGCAPHHPNDPRTATKLVLLAKAVPATGSDPEFTGVVTARVQSTLGFRVAGKITERLVDIGQAVKKGQPLLRMDRTDFLHTITAQTETVAEAKARFDQAAADEARYRGLVATGAASASTYDQMKAAADAARYQLAAVEAQARIANDEGDYTTLSADADGVVVDTPAEPGHVVAAGQTVIVLAHAGPREASINLPENIARPKLGTLAEAVLYSQPNAQYSARLRQLSDSADSQIRTFEARYVLHGAAATAPLGETVTIYLGAEKFNNAVEVPLAAVFDPGAGPGVWIFNSQNSTVSFRRVHLLQLGTETATITDGVEVGDQIVALAPHLLHEGEIVRAEEFKADAR